MIVIELEKLEKKITTFLETDFEKALFKASLVNLNEKENKLRLNNFAYATRELTRHFLYRLAPDKDVLDAPWFIPNDTAKPHAVTREQRIRYAILGYINEEFAESVLHFDYNDVSKNLRDDIKKLSKYTHVNPKTFDVDDDTTLDLAFNVMDSTLIFFKTISSAKEKISEAVYNAIDKDMINHFFMETLSEIDNLATHHEILNYNVTKQIEIERNDKIIAVQADGTVNVRLQYGSDGDMLKGDGFEIRMEFPFTSTFVTNYKNQTGDIHIESAEINVDVSDFYE